MQKAGLGSPTGRGPHSPSTGVQGSNTSRKTSRTPMGNSGPPQDKITEVVVSSLNLTELGALGAGGREQRGFVSSLLEVQSPGFGSEEPAGV